MSKAGVTDSRFFSILNQWSELCGYRIDVKENSLSTNAQLKVNLYIAINNSYQQ